MSEDLDVTFESPGGLTRFLATTSTTAIGAILVAAPFIVPRLRILPRIGLGLSLVAFGASLVMSTRALEALVRVRLQIKDSSSYIFSYYLHWTLKVFVFAVLLAAAAAMSAIVEPLQP